MQRVLIIGCGFIAMRVAPLLNTRYRLFGLVRNVERFDELRKAGIFPQLGDLDDVHSLRRLAGLADVVLHFAPPNRGEYDKRTRHLLAVLSRGRLPGRFIYISTSGVYGNCDGNYVSETHPLHPQTARAQLRVDAEYQIRNWARRNQVNANILRVPGIYAADRLPLERLRSGMAAIKANEDSFTNHIHADDLARIVIAVLHQGKANRVYHASDDDEIKIGDYLDVVADSCGLSRPPRFPRLEVQRIVSPMLWSFMNESRRLMNGRMEKELKMKLLYPKVMDALALIKRN